MKYNVEIQRIDRFEVEAENWFDAKVKAQELLYVDKRASEYSSLVFVDYSPVPNKLANNGEP